MSEMNQEGTLRGLFLTFFKIGTFTFGGGYAMIPLIQREVVENKKWISAQDVSDVLAISETTPGPIAVNLATFVGYKIKGIRGALASTLGVVLPSFLIIMIIALSFNRCMEYKIVKDAFWGIRIAVIVLMTKAFILMIRQCPKNAVSYGTGVVTLILVGIFNVNALLIIFCAAIIGIVYSNVNRGKNS